jgi:hypothetical protein
MCAGRVIHRAPVYAAAVMRKALLELAQNKVVRAVLEIIPADLAILHSNQHLSFLDSTKNQDIFKFCAHSLLITSIVLSSNTGLFSL